MPEQYAPGGPIAEALAATIENRYHDALGILEPLVSTRTSSDDDTSMLVLIARLADRIAEEAAGQAERARRLSAAAKLAGLK